MLVYVYIQHPKLCNFHFPKSYQNCKKKTLGTFRNLTPEYLGSALYIPSSKWKGCLINNYCKIFWYSMFSYIAVHISFSFAIDKYLASHVELLSLE